MIRILRSPNASTPNDLVDKPLALVWLIHLIGDIHQPLHAISRIDPETLQSDGGGNDFNVKYSYSSPIPLHALWDENLR